MNIRGSSLGNALGKPVIPRVLGILGIYFLIFMAIVIIQFAF
jgi:hypothetical protein